MTTGLKPYSEYSHRAGGWLTSLPSHWKESRGKNLFTLMSRPVRPGDDVVTCFRDGVVTLRKNRRTSGFTESLKEIGYQGVRRGDLVIHAMDAFAGAVGVSDSDGKATPVYAACQPHVGVDPYFYAHLVRQMALSRWITALATGIRERSTDFRFAQFAVQVFPLPPLVEQQAIVKYIRHVEGEVGSAVQAKQRLIGLLAEQKRVILHQAVTRGINFDAPMKESGISGVGLIPEHWEVMRAKQLCERIVDCKNRTPDMVLGGNYTVVRTTNIRSSRFNLNGSYPTDEKNYITWTLRGAPEVGDVFFTREAPAGEACLVPDIPGLCMGQRMMYFRPNRELLDSRFLLHSIYGPAIRTYIDLTTNGSTVGHLRLGQVGSLPILWCPIEEQRKIVEKIEEESQPINTAIARAEREIGLLREYQTRLTADVVTGKLDVRAAAASLPDFDSRGHNHFLAEANEDGLPMDVDPEDDATTEESM